MIGRAMPRCLFVLVATQAAGLAGCTTLAKQAFHEVRGAHGEVVLMGGVGENALSRCQSVELAPASTTVGWQICPPELLRTYDRLARDLGRELKAYYPGGQPALKVDSEILYFQKKGVMSGAFMLARVRMRADKQLVVDAVVRAESQAFRSGGENDLASACVEALGKFLRQHKQPQPAEPRPAGAVSSSGVSRATWLFDVLVGRGGPTVQAARNSSGGNDAR